VRTAPRSIYGYWIKTIGVDAFRIDTAFHVQQAFFSDFMYSDVCPLPRYRPVQCTVETGMATIVGWT